jgi:hypothetical protein
MAGHFLNGKTILVVSPQAWGNMLLSKHHYALELARRGNLVYFLNPPDNERWSAINRAQRIKIRPSGLHPGLLLIDQTLYFPYKIRFHSRSLYDRLIKKQISDLIHVIGKPVDIIWSFDLGNLVPFKYFKRNIYKVFHPVDEPSDVQAIRAAEEADIIFSVTKEILEKYKDFPAPGYFINHGLADEFAGLNGEHTPKSDKIRVGMSGNLLRTDLDRNILLSIVRENPDLDFHFFGSYRSADSNISGKTDLATDQFIAELKTFPNVELHGTLKTKELAGHLNSMDVLLICYDLEKDQSKGTNYHKVMEYLSTGKVIVSNNITTYAGEPDLVRMTSSRMNNDELPALFGNTVSDIQLFNSKELMEKRKQFAFRNSYRNQLETINEYIEKDRALDRNSS